MAKGWKNAKSFQETAQLKQETPALGPGSHTCRALLGRTAVQSRATVTILFLGAIQSSTSLDKEPALAGYLEMICSRDTPEKAKEEKTEVMKESTLDMFHWHYPPQ